MRRLWLLGTDGVAQPWLARELSAGAAARTCTESERGKSRSLSDFYSKVKYSLLLKERLFREGVVQTSLRSRFELKNGDTMQTGPGRVKTAAQPWLLPQVGQ